MGKTTSMDSKLSIEGMTCSNCGRKVREALMQVPGVESVLLDIPGGRATLTWNTTPSPIQAVKAVEAAGFGAASVSEEEIPVSRHAGRLSPALTFAASVFLVQVLLHFVPHVGKGDALDWLSSILSTAVQATAGLAFYRGAWAMAKKGSSNMDTLVALGSTTALATSWYTLLVHPGHHLYFMESTGILTFVGIGHWMEARATGRAEAAVRGLLTLAPDTADRIGPDGKESRVKVSDLEIGNLIRIRPGDAIPLDGIVREGCGGLDESTLTGESVPVTKQVGDTVYAGTRNLDASLLVEARAMGSETVLGGVVRAVERACSRESRIQRLGDRVASVFVPIVMVIAILAGLLWWLQPGLGLMWRDGLVGWLGLDLSQFPAPSAWITAAAVLIVACPCAMGLATPIALLIGATSGARHGVLIRDGIALENAGTIDTILFDKTGTLTTGQLEVLQFHQGEAAGKEMDPAQMASLAQNSRHPLAKALVRKYEPSPESSSNWQDWKEVPGHGIEAMDPEKKRWRLGSWDWAVEQHEDPGLREAVVKSRSAGHAVAILTREGRPLGYWSLEAPLRSGIHALLADLKARGLQVGILTGDHAEAAHWMADALGINRENVVAGVLPDGKAEVVERLQKQGRRVAFVGDGINDAPALQQAELGIAIGGASDMARDTADLVLLNAEIPTLAYALDLSRSTLRVIRQNLFWAFFYNTAAIPLATLGLLSPMLCAMAMGLSDLVVVGNAYRLRGCRPRRMD